MMNETFTRGTPGGDATLSARCADGERASGRDRWSPAGNAGGNPVEIAPAPGEKRGLGTAGRLRLRRERSHRVGDCASVNGRSGKLGTSAVPELK